MKRGVVWVETREWYATQEQLFKDKQVMAIIWIADYDTETITGDDWDDAPHHANAGPPYENLLKNLVKMEVRLNSNMILNVKETKRE